MTGIPTTGDHSQPHEWSISKRTLIVSADSKRVLAVLNGRDPLLFPPGSVLQFGDPLGELVVTRVRVIVSEGSGTAAPGGPAERPGHLQRVAGQPPRWSRVRPGNG